MNGDVAAQKFLDNIEYMDRALYRTIKEAMLRNVEGSQIAWCQYGSLLHSSELLKRDEQQMVTSLILFIFPISVLFLILLTMNWTRRPFFYFIKKYIISLIP